MILHPRNTITAGTPDAYALAGLTLADFIQRPAWQADAQCKEHPYLSWVSKPGGSNAEQRAICAHCAVQAECLEAAIEGQELGLWGGTSTTERRAMPQAPHPAPRRVIARPTRGNVEPARPPLARDAQRPTA